MINRKALTFIELLIVIIIIGVLAGVSTPLFSRSFDSLEIEGFVKDIYYLSRYLQSNAISQGKIYLLEIDKDAGSFLPVYKEGGGNRNINGRFGKPLNAPEGVTVSCEPAESSGIYFYPDGSTDKATVTFRNRRGDNISLVTKGVSGEIKVQ